ncbi:MAG: AsmA family protein [Polyangiales bacterium]
MTRAGIVVGIVVVLIGMAVAADLAFDLIVEKAVETIGPAITGTRVEIDDVDLSILDGQGSLQGLRIGNPRGFKTKYAFRLREVRVHLVPMSIFREKIVIRDIRIDEPNVNFEQKDGTNNLERILRHIQLALGGGGGGDEEAEGNDAEAIWEQLLEQKVQIDHFLMKDAAVHASGGVLEGKRLDVPPLTIELEGLGTGPEGDSVARVSAKVMRRISSRVSLAVTERMLTLGLGGQSARSERRRESDGEDETQEADSTPDDEAPRRGKHRRQ